jgi:hypothetical protein
MSDPDRAHILHRALKDARRAQRSADHRVAVLLGEMDEGQHYKALGYVTLADYARGELELDKRRTDDLVRIARSLPSLPAMSSAMAEGRLDFTKARELLRVVRPDTEAAWIQRVETLTNREIERMVRAVPKGSPPPDDVPPAELGLHRRKMVFEGESTDVELVMAALRLAQSEARAGGSELDDGAALAVLARYWLERHETDEAPGTAVPFRVVVHAEPSGDLRAGENEVSQTTGERALCDAEIVDLGHGPTRGHVTRTIPPARREAVLARDDYRCVVPGCRSRHWLEVHHLKAKAWGGTHHEDNLATVCNGHHQQIHEGTLALERLSDGRWLVETPTGRKVGPPPRPLGVGEPRTAPPYGVPFAWRSAMEIGDG